MNMKKNSLIVSLLGTAVSLLSLSASADVGTAALMTSGGTITNNATQTTGFTAQKMDNQTSATLVIKFSGDQAGTGNIAVQLARSYDGVNFESAPPATLRFTNAMAGATTVIGVNPISSDLVRDVHSLKITSLQSYETTAKGTNASIFLLLKRVR
jgi:hypothetical protein